MKTWIYTIESEHSANPEVILFGSYEEMQRRFVQDIIEDEREGYDAKDPDNPSIAKLKSLKENGAAIEKQFAMAIDIYDAVIEDGTAGMPFYHGHLDVLGRPVPTGGIYTVVLLYPDYLNENYGQETWTSAVKGNSPEEAIANARKEVKGDMRGALEEEDDMFCIACFAGEHIDMDA
mgnify:CR=1 FL=1